MTQNSGRKPTYIERKILVWTGKYANDSEIPSRIPFSTMVRVKDMARVYLAGGMAIVVAGCFLFTALKSKRLLEEGNTVSRMNRNWHEEFNKTGQIGPIREVPSDFEKRMNK